MRMSERQQVECVGQSSSNWISFTTSKTTWQWQRCALREQRGKIYHKMCMEAISKTERTVLFCTWSCSGRRVIALSEGRVALMLRSIVSLLPSLQEPPWIYSTWTALISSSCSLPASFFAYIYLDIYLFRNTNTFFFYSSSLSFFSLASRLPHFFHSPSPSSSFLSTRHSTALCASHPSV